MLMLSRWADEHISIWTNADADFDADADAYDVADADADAEKMRRLTYKQMNWCWADEQMNI